MPKLYALDGPGSFNPAAFAPSNHLRWAEALTDVEFKNHLLALLAALNTRPTNPTPLLVLTGGIALQMLRTAALAGSEEAKDWLTGILQGAVGSLNNDAEHFAAQIRTRAAFPVLYSQVPEFATKTDKLTGLGLGADYKLALKGSGSERAKTISYESPANKLVKESYDLLWQFRFKWGIPTYAKRFEADKDLPQWVRDSRTLPDLSPSTWEQWEKVGWAATLYSHNGKPEREKSLSAIGAHRKSRTAKSGGLASENSHVRNGIRERFKKAWKALAAPNSKTT